MFKIMKLFPNKNICSGNFYDISSWEINMLFYIEINMFMFFWRKNFSGA
jgi:hypothetical protein